MKARYIIDVYIIPEVLELRDGGRDDIDEQAGNQLDKNAHFNYQMHASSLKELGERLLKNHEIEQQIKQRGPDWGRPII